MSNVLVELNEFLLDTFDEEVALLNQRANYNDYEDHSYFIIQEEPFVGCKPLVFPGTIAAGMMLMSFVGP